MPKRKIKISDPLYFGVLVPEVLNDRELSITDRAILSIVINFVKLSGRCYANNMYFVKMLNSSKSVVSNSLNKLEKGGYIIPLLPDAGRGGRGRYRTVRHDIIHIPGDRKTKGSHINLNNLHSQKPIHNSKLNNNEYFNDNTKIKSANTEVSAINEDNTIALSKLEEQQLVEQLLIKSINDKWGMYGECKWSYNQYFPIEWDEQNVIDLISLCNKLIKTYCKDFDKISADKKSEAIVSVFDALLCNKPKWFTDCLPQTFLQYFRKVIHQEEFLEYLRCSGYFPNKYPKRIF